MRAGQHALLGQRGRLHLTLIGVRGHDEDRVRPLTLQHLAVIPVRRRRAEGSRVLLSPLHPYVANGQQLDRRVLERGVHVAVGMLARSDEGAPQPLGVLELVADHPR